MPGNKIEITCKVITYPTPDLTWTRNGEIQPMLHDAFDLSLNKSIQSFVSKYDFHEDSAFGAELYINLDKSDSGSQYKCLMNGTVVIHDLNVTLIGNSIDLFNLIFINCF